MWKELKLKIKFRHKNRSFKNLMLSLLQEQIQLLPLQKWWFIQLQSIPKYKLKFVVKFKNTWKKTIIVMKILKISHILIIFKNKQQDALDLELTYFQGKLKSTIIWTEFQLRKELECQLWLWLTILIKNISKSQPNSDHKGGKVNVIIYTPLSLVVSVVEQEHVLENI